MDLDTIRYIQILSLKAVEQPDYNAFYRRICRWYSMNFSTPLKTVEKYDEFHVLQTYFEHQYQELYSAKGEEAQRLYQDLRTELLKSPEEVQKEQQADEDWIRQLEKEAMEHGQASKSSKQNTLSEHPNLIKEGFFQGESDEESI